MITQQINMKFLGFEFRKVQPEQRADTEQVSISDALLFGNFRNAFGALNLSAVFRCVDLISDNVAMLPIRVVNKDKKHKTELENHSLNIVFSQGTKVINKSHFMKLLIQSVLLKGNGFALIDRANDGTVTGLRFIESGDVQIHFDKYRKENGLYYTCNLIPSKKIEPINMIHLLKYSFDGVTGKSVLGFAERTLKLSGSSEDSALGLFSNGCNLSGVLKVEGQLTKEQRQNIHTTWNQAMSNGGNGLAVLQGNMSYQPIQLSAEDSQLLQSRLFQVEEICRFFGVNPVLVGDLSHSSYSTLEAAQTEFLVHTLQPYIVMVEEEFTKKLLKPSESHLEINLDETAILRTDKAALANYYGTLLDKGILCINEVRDELGYGEIEGGDKHLIAYTDINQNTVNKNGKQE